MIPFIVYAVGALGFSYIVGYSRISLPFRKWLAAKSQGGTNTAAGAAMALALTECLACGGFWTGLFYGLIVQPEWAAPFTSLELALATCGSNFLLGVLTGLVGGEET